MARSTEKRYELVHLGTTQPWHLKPGELPIVVSYGAGRHSWGLVVKMATDRRWRDFRRRVAMILHSDLGAEVPETTAHLHEVAIPFLQRHEWDLTIIRPRVRARDGHVYTRIYDYYFAQACLPTRARLSCTTRFKIVPCQQATRDLVGEAVTAIGYHAGEMYRPGRISQALLANRIFPLIDFGMDHDACVQASLAAGLPVPVKSACHFCMNSKVREMELLCECHPELMARNIALEENMHAKRGRTDITLLSLSMRRIQDRWEVRRQTPPPAPIARVMREGRIA